MQQIITKHIIWILVAILGAFALGTVALHKGETINALWLVVASTCVYLIGYRYYSLFISDKVLKLNINRVTPAHRHNDGLDYVPTNKFVLFGHHFAAIAGAGPLVGPVLAAQMGYLPGVLWLLVGVVFAGAVQDFCILVFSSRRDGRSLGDMIKGEVGHLAGVIALVGILMIIVVLIAVLALVVVKALAESPWGTFTVFSTVPIALFMGLYLRFIRPGKVGEISVIGFIALIASIFVGGHVAADPVWGPRFTFEGTHLALMIIGYGFFSSIMPVWLLLAPRDYLATFLKIGTILGLALGILWVMPSLKMPAVTQFIDGTGPVFAGKLFPFLFITIACGAVSGFHSLIASGTTPKMLEDETQARFIGYGAMLMESFVAVMALIAATAMDPGEYFALNSPASLIGTTPESAAQVISSWGFVITPETLTQTAKDVGEHSIISRAGGAPTLAVGMAKILAAVFTGDGMMAFFYHFAILFEALFILTTIDSGTRVARFMLHDLIGMLYAPMKRTDFLPTNMVTAAICVTAWGYFLYQGVIDPLGGINTLWPLFGISNQMLAGMALIYATVILFKMKQERYAWVTLFPAVWVLICTFTAGAEKLFHADPRISFLAHANKFQTALDAGTVLAPAKSIEDMHRIVFNDYIDAGMCLFFVSVVLAMGYFSIVAIMKALKDPNPSVLEIDGMEVKSA